MRKATSAVFARWTLRGKAFSSTSIRLYGHVIRLSAVAASISSISSVLASPRASEARVETLLSEGEKALPREMADTKVRPYSPMWATFCSNTSLGPFDDVSPRTAAQVSSQLGLARSGGPAVLLHYQLQADQPAFKPTIADAYAWEGEWPYYFRPAPRVEPCGMTMPTDPAHQPKPEIVHTPIGWSQVEQAWLLA
ncbi:MAG TPA: hypothetical protein VJT73_07905 [Polyangiaceae bacterium]|nr:hypothetical protein [Polyangiaceae bacterium]